MLEWAGEVTNPLVYEKALEKLVYDEYFAQVVDHRGPNDSTWLSRQKTQGAAIHLQMNALRYVKHNGRWNAHRTTRCRPKCMR